MSGVVSEALSSGMLVARDSGQGSPCLDLARMHCEVRPGSRHVSVTFLSVGGGDDTAGSGPAGPGGNGQGHPHKFPHEIQVREPQGRRPEEPVARTALGGRHVQRCIQV